MNTTHSTIYAVDLDKVTTDARVQRREGVNQTHVEKIAAAFDPAALGVLILSHRADGSYVILDGAHRRAAALKVGWTGPVDSRVFDGLTLQQEASLFLLYNNKKDPSSISRFSARVVAGDEVAVAIDAITRENGWTIRQDTHTPGSLPAVDTMERVYRNGAGVLPDGAYPDVVRRVLVTLTDAWGHDPIATHSAILGGLGQLYGRLGDAVDTRKLVREMQSLQPRELVGKAKTYRDLQGGTVPAALARILVGLHNNRRRTNVLPDWIWIR